MSSSGKGAASLEPDDFRKQLFAQLHASGVVNSLKSQLRTQMLAQLQSRYAAGVQPPSDEKPSLARRAVNSLIAEYLGWSKYDYTLSIFQPESGLSSSSAAALSAEEIMQVLHLSKPSPLSQALGRRGFSRFPQMGEPGEVQQATAGRLCFIIELFESIKEVNGMTMCESATQTYEEGAFRLGTQLQILEDRYASRSQENASKPYRTMEERMAVYRREVDERSKQEVAQQVERVRELEISQVRFEEAARYRKELEAERQELEKVYAQRAAKLREREEAQNERLRRQQRDVEGAAFEHRQRIVKEEDRLRAWKAEVQKDVDKRTDELNARVIQIQARESAVLSREAEAERRNAEAMELLAEAKERTRRKVLEELATGREELQLERLAVESERARLLEQRAQAATELTEARVTAEKLRSAIAARDEAELRANAHKAAEETMRLRLTSMANELQDLQSQKRTLDASFNSAMSAHSFGYLINAPPPGTPNKDDLLALKDALRRSENSRKRAQREAAAAKQQLQAAAGQEHATIRIKHRMQLLLDEGIDKQENALQVMEDMELAFGALCREAEDLQTSNARLRRDLIRQLTMKGMSADVGRVPLPKVSVHALQAANELKNEVEQLRREVAEYQRKVERERASERREVQPDMPVSINLSMAAPEVAYVSDTDKENYTSNGETDVSPLQRHHQALNASNLQGRAPGSTPAWAQQITASSLPPGAQSPPPGFVEALVNGHRVFIPAGVVPATPIAAQPSGPISPLQDFIARSISQTPQQHQLSRLRASQISQGDSVEARIQPTDRTDYSMLREQPRQTDAGASEAEIGHRQEDTRQEPRNEEAKQMHQRLQDHELQAKEDRKKQQEKDRLSAEEQERAYEERERCRQQREQEDIAAEQQKAAAAKAADERQQQAAREEQRKAQDMRDREAEERKAAAAKAADERQQQAAREEQRKAQDMRDREAEQRRAEEQQERQQREEEEEERRKEEEQRRKEVQAEKEEEGRSKHQMAAEEERQPEEQNVEKDEEQSKAQQEEYERQRRLEEYRRAKEEQRKREEEEALAAQTVADLDNLSAPSQSGSFRDFDDQGLYSDDLVSPPAELEDIGDSAELGSIPSDLFDY